LFTTEVSVKLTDIELNMLADWKYPPKKKARMNVDKKRMKKTFLIFLRKYMLANYTPYTFALFTISSPVKLLSYLSPLSIMYLFGL
jgi:hypothetical protein